MAQVQAQEKSKRNLIVGGSVLGALLLIFLGGPLFSASSWKSSTLEKTNAVITSLNTSNRDISLYATKLQPTADDYVKLLSAYDQQIKTVQSAKKDLSEVGGISFFDVTGDYKKASDTHKELVSTYDELLVLDNIGRDRAKAEQDVAKLFSDETSVDSVEQLAASVASFRDAASKIQSFASTPNGTENDKKTAAAFVKLADALQAIVDADASGDTAKADAASATIDEVSAELDSLTDASIKDQEAMQKKFDANVERLNKAAKSLE